jgi:hypothetical protein
MDHDDSVSMRGDDDHANRTGEMSRAVTVFAECRRVGVSSSALSNNAPATTTGTAQARRIAMAAWHCSTKRVPARR